jgi:hypothetical protein
MKYLPGDIYTNSNTTNIANIIAGIVSYPLYKSLRIKYSMLVAYVIPSIGVFCIIMLGH